MMTAQTHIIKTFTKLIELLPEPDRAKVCAPSNLLDPALISVIVASDCVTCGLRHYL